MSKLPNINLWTNEDLQTLPNNETEIYEYKSSKISLDNLKNKISVAASAFWNSGGGIFIAGVNDEGNVDGGIPAQKGRQTIRDWADEAIKQTQPCGDYEIGTIRQPSDKVVLVIKFNESKQVPHMASDKKHYIRTGARSEGANYFLVEALRVYRNYSTPNLVGLLKINAEKPSIVELVVVSINEAVALDVEIDFEPYSEALKYVADKFPLHMPLIDRNNPFRMDILVIGAREASFGKAPISMNLKYKDTMGANYATSQTISPQNNFPSHTIGNDKILELTKAINNLAKKIK